MTSGTPLGADGTTLVALAPRTGFEEFHTSAAAPAMYGSFALL